MQIQIGFDQTIGQSAFLNKQRMSNVSNNITIYEIPKIVLNDLANLVVEMASIETQ